MKSCKEKVKEYFDEEIKFSQDAQKRLIKDGKNKNSPIVIDWSRFESKLKSMKVLLLSRL